jgi:hypothetical protein
VILLGAGGHAKVLVEVLRLNHCDIVGLFTPDFEMGSKYLGLEVLGDDDDELENYDPAEVDLVNGNGSLPYQRLRWDVSNKVRE